MLTLEESTARLRRSGARGVCLLLAVLAVTLVHARRPSEAPPLPAPNPMVYQVIEVNTAQELADACWNLASDQAIVIASGNYDLGSVTFPNGVDGRLAVGRFGQPPISNIQIRGATGNPADVVLIGDGMLDPAVPFGFQVATATEVLIADLSISAVYYHAVMINGGSGAARIRLYHVRAGDTGQQIIKGSGAGADEVSIEFSEIYYSIGAAVHPDLGSCYTNGIDATGGDNWIVRDNLIQRIRCQDGSLAGPAVLLWQGSSGSLVERNTIVDSSRGISLGLVGGDHAGGVVRNNFIRWDPGAAYAVDVPIYSVSPDSKILHNTALVRGNYPNAIEIRFSGATNVMVQNNLLDAAVTLRDGASLTPIDNITTAETDWFLDQAVGDLHLTLGATDALDQVTRLADAPTDFDDLLRPPGVGLSDIGASEFLFDPLIFEDGFE